MPADAPFGPGSSPYPVGPEHVGLVVEVVRPSSRRTDRFAKPGEYAEAGIPLFWRVETAPAPVLVVHRLAGASYEQVAVVTAAAGVLAPWGVAPLELGSLSPRS